MLYDKLPSDAETKDIPSRVPESLVSLQLDQCKEACKQTRRELIPLSGIAIDIQSIQSSNVHPFVPSYDTSQQ
jgi:hypothetical protein